MPLSDALNNYKKGDTVKAVVSKVEMKNGTPSIIVSRTSPVFLERLFETEVPEISGQVHLYQN